MDVHAILSLLRSPCCRATLSATPEGLHCDRCRQRYEIDPSGIAVLLPPESPAQPGVAEPTAKTNESRP
ncbi:hypothetical protein SCOR_35755 [Sulfidibacter corallicola]